MATDSSDRTRKQGGRQEQMETVDSTGGRGDREERRRGKKAMQGGRDGDGWSEGGDIGEDRMTEDRKRTQRGLLSRPETLHSRLFHLYQLSASR